MISNVHTYTISLSKLATHIRLWNNVGYTVIDVQYESNSRMSITVKKIDSLMESMIPTRKTS